MKVYFDTNIIVDILKHREPYYEDSYNVFMLIIDGKIEGIVGASAITDIYYLIKKQYSNTQEAVNIIMDILEIIKPVNTLTDDIFAGAALHFEDFEDAVIATTAQREQAQYIITRNVHDFINSPVPPLHRMILLQNDRP